MVVLCHEHYTMIFYVGEHIWRAKTYQVGTYFIEVAEGVWIKYELRGYSENFCRAKTFVAQGFFSAAQGKRNFVQKEGRKSYG